MSALEATILSTRPGHMHSLNPGENTAPCTSSTLPFSALTQAAHLDEAMKGTVCLSSELADICQRDLRARVWIARDTSALELRLT